MKSFAGSRRRMAVTFMVMVFLIPLVCEAEQSAPAQSGAADATKQSTPSLFIQQISTYKLNESEVGVGAQNDTDTDTEFLNRSLGDFPVTVTGSSSAALDGRTANSSTNLEVSLTFSAETNTLSGTVTGSGSAMATPDSLADAVGHGESNLRIDFLSQTPFAFTLSGSIVTTGTGPDIAMGEGAVSLVFTGSPRETVVDVEAFAPPLPNAGIFDSATPNISQSFDPGNYTLHIGYYVLAERLGLSDVDLSCTSQISIDFSIQAEELVEPMALMWEANDGAFEEATNWDPQQVPSDADTAIFDRDASYAVQFSQLENSSRVLVERGDVTFSGGEYRLTSDSTEAEALVVGNSTSDNAVLTLFSHVLSGLSAVVGGGANSPGFLSVGTSSLLDVENLIVGDEANGTLTITNNGRSTTGATIIGNNADGLLSIAGSGARWDFTGDLTVGRFSLGDLSVTDGAKVVGASDTSVKKGGFVPTVRLGEDSLAEASVLLSGVDTEFTVPGTFIVGGQGRADLDVVEGATLNARILAIGNQLSTIAADVMVGSVDGENGGGIITLTEDLIVGNQGNGAMTVRNGSSVSFLNAAVAALAPETIAQLTVHDADIIAGGTIFVGRTPSDDPPELPSLGVLQIMNRGQVVADTVEVRAGSSLNVIAGDVDANVNVNGTMDIELPLEALPVKGATISGLGITGDLNVDGGTLTIDISGTAMQDIAALNIFGNATFANATIVLNFVNGFGPRTGETFPFLNAQGALDLGNTEFSYAGAEIGFEYIINNETGVLVLEALNDAVPTTAPLIPEDVDGNGVIDAVDVQLVINAALGLETVEDTDVNDDNMTDAVDVQRVINAALGV